MTSSIELKGTLFKEGDRITKDHMNVVYVQAQEIEGLRKVLSKVDGMPPGFVEWFCSPQVRSS